MQKAKIEIKGIARAASNQAIDSGWMDELINLRHRAGKIQPVGNATKLYELPSGTFTAIWKHEQDGIDNYIGLTDSYDLKLINMGVGTSTLIKTYSGEVSVVFLKRYMIVIYADGMDRFLYKNNEYALITMPSRPRMTYFTNEALPYTTDSGTDAEALKGQYYEKLNEASEDNYHTGGIMFRAAFKLFDGSYVLHTIPEYLRLGMEMEILESPYKIKFRASKVSISIPSLYLIDLNTDIFTHITIFACKNEELYEVSELDDTMLVAGDFSTVFSAVNPKFKKMADSESWYKIHEFNAKEIRDAGETVTEEVDMKGFYQDYATRETLPVDQFSFHTLSASISYNYNSRLILGHTVTVFGDYTYYPLNPFLLGLGDNIFIPSGYTYEENRNVMLLVELDTDSGEKQKLIDVGSRPFYTKDGQTPSIKYMTVSKDVLGYPDARATKINVLVQDGGSYYIVYYYNLKKSLFGNYAYYFDPDFGVIAECNFASGTLVFIENYDDDSYADTNRIQISELNNPFFFPAENSYQVGTGKIDAVATNTEPLSTGQYGEYPLIVFTSKGIWTLFQGQGDVLFSSVKPLNGEVIKNTDHVTSIGTGVTYATDRGLFLIQGREVTELSKLLQGRPNLEIQATDNFKLRINYLSLVQLPDSVSEIDALDYISGANCKIGFDKKNNELIITNPRLAGTSDTRNTNADSLILAKYSLNSAGYDLKYSYIYSFDSGLWHKISRSFDILIDSYPDLIALSTEASNDGVFNVSVEHFDTDISAIALTRPVKISGEPGFILLHRAIQRCEIETTTSTYAGFYIFGSNDLITWQLLQGNDKKTGRVVDLLCTRSHLKIKYFVFLFAASLKELSSLNSIDLQCYAKLSNKIR